MKLISLAVSCLLHFFCHSQTLKPGDHFPFDRLPGLLKKEIVKGRPIILDAFSSRCTSCFSTLPELKRLQEKYRGTIQIILIGKNDEKIRRIYQRYASHFRLRFPVIFDSTFFHFANFQFLPSYLWIDSSGIIRDITGPSGLSDENVGILIAGENKLAVQQPLTLMRSELSRWMRGQPIISPSLPSVESDSLSLKGITLSNLFLFAFIGKTYISSKDSVYGLFYPKPIFEKCKADSFRYNYEVRIDKPQDQRTLRKILREDLARSFSYMARLETRELPYWKFIVLGNDTSRVATKFERPSGNVSHSEIKIKNCVRSDLMHILHRYYPFDPPILDKTGMKGNIDIHLEGVLSDIEVLRKELQKNGFDLVESKKPMQVLVLYLKERDVAVMR